MSSVRAERALAAGVIVLFAVVVFAALWLGGPLLEFIMPRLCGVPTGPGC